MARRTQFEVWEDMFSPVKNHLKKTRQFEGCLYETYGPELEFIKTLADGPDAGKVWTVVQGDNGKWYVASGFHYVNRIGYLVSSVPLDEGNKKHVRYLTKDVYYL